MEKMEEMKTEMKEEIKKLQESVDKSSTCVLM